MEKLRRGQIIMIDAQKYVVNNMIEFKEDSWIWQEYEIQKYFNGDSNRYQKYWLTIEQDEHNKNEYYLYSRYAKIIDVNNIEFEDNGKSYKLFESGIATVKSYFGPTDVDPYEKCKYYDYISESENEILSVEIWSDETEYTIGEKINDYQIQIKDEIDKEYLKKNTINSSKFSIFILWFCIILFIFPFIGYLFGGIFVNESMDKYLSKNTSKYTYVTSVTNNSNNKKAKIYMVKLNTLDETVKDIIDGVPEGITEVIDDDSNTEKDGFALETKNEYAYIYMNEDGMIFIQISDKEYVNNSATTYHSSHNAYYHRSYRRRVRSISYYNYASSARQSSVNSRNYSGGGTSSGK